MRRASGERKELGAAAEDAAARTLKAAGYKILERNYRCAAGEVDIVAFEDGNIVFVEVRAKSSDRFGTPAESVNARKQRQICRVARQYLAKKRVEDRLVRFDVVAVEVSEADGFRCEVIRDAFVCRRRKRGGR